jgi:hypothetical protein
MEKIIVLIGESEHDEYLIDCLKNLFPDCEIEIQARESSVNRENKKPDISTISADDANMDKKLNKFMSFL